MVPLIVATEDELSEAIARRILAKFPTILSAGYLRRGGSGYLRSKMPSFCEIARRGPILVLTDLDTKACSSALRKEWLGNLKHPPGLLLRVVEREIESWLMADHDAVGTILGKFAQRRLPEHPDTLTDPKDFLLRLAKHSPRNIRLDLCAEDGAIARQGLGYNARLCDLVRTSWQPHRAAERSPSLRRAINRIRELVAGHAR